MLHRTTKNHLKTNSGELQHDNLSILCTTHNDENSSDLLTFLPKIYWLFLNGDFFQIGHVVISVEIKLSPCLFKVTLWMLNARNLPSLFCGIDAVRNQSFRFCLKLFHPWNVPQILGGYDSQTEKEDARSRKPRANRVQTACKPHLGQNHGRQ